ncbi:MAG: glycosyltransferase family 9 protein [Gammaproteobacteria bacterium]
MSNKYLIVILRFHGDVLLTKPMIDNIKLNDPDGEIDLLLYKGTGSILEQEKSIGEIIEIDNASKANIFSRIKKEINLWAKVRSKKYNYAFFLTTQWRVVPISWAIGKAKKSAVDDKKRRKSLWTKSFSVIFPEALDNHIIQRNLSALKSLELKVFNEDLMLDPVPLEKEYKILSDSFPFLNQDNGYCLIGKKKFSVVITSGPDLHEIGYVEEILKNADIVDEKVLNLAGKTSLLGLAALISRSKFFIGLDSVASHIAASVNKESITLFGPSNPNNWKPWSNRAKVIVRDDLKNIEVGDVISLAEEMYP